MSNEVNTGLGLISDAEATTAALLSARVFDPATLLDRSAARDAPPPTIALMPETAPTFDPAAYLGDAAQRGPAKIGDGKPLVARIGGVEVVTIPAEHYAALVSPVLLARPGVTAGAGTPDPESMLLFLLSLHADGAVSIEQLAQATGLDLLDLGDRIAAYAAAQPKPWQVDGIENGTFTGLTGDGMRFHLTPLPPEPAPIEVAPTAEEATIDLPTGLPSTAEEQAAAYDDAAARQASPGGAMDREGRPSEPTGKGMAAHDAERGTAKRSRK